MLGDQVVKELSDRLDLQPFQRDWLLATFNNPEIAISALSMPRGNGKTRLCAEIAALAMTENSCLWRENIETVVVASSLEQARILHGFAVKALGSSDYKHLDSGQRIASVHIGTGTRLRVMSSDPKRALGLSQWGLIICEEAAAWEARNGALMWSAIKTSQGKLEDQRILLCGTLAPAPENSWWPDLVGSGSTEGTHISVLQGDPKKPFDDWPNIEQCNPLMTANPALGKAIRRELEDARRNPTERRQFQAFRLNQHLDVSSEMLIQLDEWREVEKRPVPERRGRCIVGFDVGESRSWSAAWLVWENGRSECYALTGGVPDLATKGRQDSQPGGLYEELAASGSLLIDQGRKSARMEVLIDHLLASGVKVASLWADRFLFERLQDHVRGRFPVHKRVLQWSTATDDICDFRDLARDGKLSIAPESRKLAVLSLGSACVQSDTSGNSKLVKRSKTRSRDDIAVAGALACGAYMRESRRPRRRIRLAA